LNASIVTYTSRKRQINDMIAEMNALESKQIKKNPLGKHELTVQEKLEDYRRKVAKYVRSTITGGDIF
jgi:predicted hydrolase (HD superfamily)